MVLTKDLEASSHEPATKVQRTDWGPETKDQLIPTTASCDTFTSDGGTYGLIITSSGHLYIDAQYDGTLNAQSVCRIQSHFEQCNVALDLKPNWTTRLA
ncbi:MAG: hypothetical protein ACKPKO_52380, partial [Candidatus Fonsibacter sp.]